MAMVDDDDDDYDVDNDDDNDDDNDIDVDDDDKPFEAGSDPGGICFLYFAFTLSLIHI